MKILKWLFGDSYYESDSTHHPMENHKYLFLETIIMSVEDKPEDYSAKWFNKNSLDSSVRSKNTRILISTCDYSIIQPLKITPKGEHLKRLKIAVDKIVERDSMEIIKKYIE